MRPKSKSLFHFTKTLDYLKEIIKSGFNPRFCSEDTRYLGIDNIAFPMSCFCDIPISRIDEHTSFYGEYGIGMTKEWGQRNRLEPLIYATNSGSVAKFMNYILDIEPDSIPDGAKNLHTHIVRHFYRILCLTKPISGQMPIGDKLVKKDFYQENEWRYVPENYQKLMQEDHEEEMEKRNTEMKKHSLSFRPNDVKYIFVKSDSEIPIIFDFIQNNLGKWPLNEIKILCSRITSLETIAHDV